MRPLLVFALAFGSYAAALETSDLEDSIFLKLEKLPFFSKRQNAVRLGEPTNALYGYDGGPGTKDWGGLCNNGTSQSPIDFIRETTTPVFRRILRFNGLDQTPLSTNISNSGHSVKLKLKTQRPITVTGGVFNDLVYEFQQLHFHWGRNMREGSEHTLASKRYPLETHAVFYKANSRNPTEEVNGIAVLGFFSEQSTKDNPVLDPLVKAIDQIIDTDQFIVRAGGNTLQSYLPANLDTYFNYRGSLTTPPCTEGVTWVFFQDRRTVSERQVAKMKTIRDPLGLTVDYNFRETQQLNARPVLLVTSSERIVA